VEEARMCKGERIRELHSGPARAGGVESYV
jgi:hypothetical protein